jgi:hypothetical protein
MLLISRRHVRFVDRWWSDNFLLFGGDVFFVTIDRVVVFGDERGDEERFGLRSLSERGGGRDKALF